METGTNFTAETAQTEDPKGQLPLHLQRAVEEGMLLEQALACIKGPQIVKARPATSKEELPAHLRIAVENGMAIEQALGFAVVTE